MRRSIAKQRSKTVKNGFDPNNIHKRFYIKRELPVLK